MPHSPASTDEYEKVTDQLLQTERKLEEAQQEIWMRRAKAFAIAAGAVGTMATAVLAHFRPETLAAETAGVAASAIEEQTSVVKAAQAACERAAAEGVAKAKAEADAVRTLVLGYLLANQGRVSGSKVEAALGAVVDQLGKDKAETFQLKPGQEPTKPAPKAESAEPQIKKLKSLSEAK